MASSKDDTNNSFRNGAKFGAGVILVIIILVSFVRFEVTVESENEAVNNNLEQSSPATPSNQNLAEKTVNEAPPDIYETCGNSVCEEHESIELCSLDCKGLVVGINDYEFVDKVGGIPDSLRGMFTEEELNELQDDTRFFYFPKTDHELLVLDVTLLNNGTDSVSYRTAKLRDEDGFLIEMLDFTGRLEKGLYFATVDDIPKKSQLRGKIAFEIPDMQSGFDLIIVYINQNFELDEQRLNFTINR